MVQFCPEHEKLLRKKKIDGETYLVCPVEGCEFKEKSEAKKLNKTKRNKQLEKKITDNKTRIIGDEPAMELKPKTKVECPECGNMEAFYEQFQTRSADEPATTFYSCTGCGHRWREY